jgi:hypothetical protein
MIRGGFRWTASSSTGSATPSRRIFTRWYGNAAVQRATSGKPSRTNFSATVSNVPFTLRYLSHLYSGRPLGVGVLSQVQDHGQRSYRPRFPRQRPDPRPQHSSGAESALRARELHYSALLAILKLSQSLGRPATGGDPHG